MKSFASRRIRNVGVLLCLAALFVFLSSVSAAALRDTPRQSGWALLTLVVFLALYNARKKLPFLPLGTSAAWLQIHIYAGLLSAVAVGIHVQWRVPTGAFECVLALLYAGVFASGVFGLFISRSFPKRLTSRGDEVLFERISSYRRQLQSEVQAIVLRCQEESESTAIQQFYAERLEPFLKGPRHFWDHLWHSNRPRRDLLNEIKAHDRYLNETERQAMHEIAGRVEAKDNLDYQYTLQATLKYWLFAHVPLTYALLVFAFFHLWLVSAFAGGAS